MPRSADDLIYEVAGILGRAVPGEALGQIEYDVISGQVDNTIATVARIVSLYRDSIPEELFKAVADIVAAFSAARFSQSEADPIAISRLEDRLRVLVAPPRTRRTLRIDAALQTYRRGYPYP
jgi:hypothetical protein